MAVIDDGLAWASAAGGRTSSCRQIFLESVFFSSSASARRPMFVLSLGESCCNLAIWVLPKSHSAQACRGNMHSSNLVSQQTNDTPFQPHRASIYWLGRCTSGTILAWARGSIISQSPPLCSRLQGSLPFALAPHFVAPVKDVLSGLGLNASAVVPSDPPVPFMSSFWVSGDSF